jgi:hypothetical protein
LDKGGNGGSMAMAKRVFFNVGIGYSELASSKIRKVETRFYVPKLIESCTHFENS